MTVHGPSELDTLRRKKLSPCRKIEVSHNALYLRVNYRPQLFDMPH